MIDYLLIIMPLMAGFLRYIGGTNKTNLLLAQSVLASACLISITRVILQVPAGPLLSLNILTPPNTWLKFLLTSDQLSRVMTVVILFLGTVIYSYSERYLRSESSVKRFLFQIGCCLTSVLIFVHAANLWTAFVGWQLIGLTTFLLLNHYHYDRAAGESARKKFLINRLGDTCFLIALIIADQQVQSSAFNALSQSPHAPVIFLLVFFAVMTKSAQYPFHQWLSETMQAPTPVSALMHAGIINAGGILLARLFPLMTGRRLSMAIVVLCGGITMFFAAAAMRSQYDIKRKLAYSTMGQMGYMLLQLGLGCPTAAVFHLIAHGFFKAGLFLNAGNALYNNNRVLSGIRELPRQSVVTALCLSLIIIGLAWLINSHLLMLNLPLIMYTFFFITLSQMLLWFTQYLRPRVILIHAIILTSCLGAYFLLLKGLGVYLAIQDNPGLWPLTFQIAASILLLACQFLVWLQPQSFTAINRVLSGPLDALKKLSRYSPLKAAQGRNHIRHNAASAQTGRFNSLTGGIAGIVVMCAISLMLLTHPSYAVTGPHQIKFGAGVILTLAAFCLMLAWQSRTLSKLVFWLWLFEIMIAIMIIRPDGTGMSWAVLHLIHLLPLLMITLLIRYIPGQKKGYPIPHPLTQSSLMSWPLIYLITCVLLLTALPGTVGFIEVYKLMSVFYSRSLIALVLTAAVFILLAAAILKLLSLYVPLNPKRPGSSPSMRAPIIHGLFGVTLLLNILLGIMPGYFMASL